MFSRFTAAGSSWASEKNYLQLLTPQSPCCNVSGHHLRAAFEAFPISKIAATIAAFMGKDYRKDVPRAAAPIDAVLAGGR